MIKKMQPYTFQNVHDLFAFLPPPELQTLLFLRQLIQQTIPNIKEKLSYSVPFYFGKKRICYLWPQSVLWNNKTQALGVNMGFCQGHRLLLPNNYFIFQNRKQICSKNFSNIHDIHIPSVLEYLHRAAIIDASS